MDDFRESDPFRANRPGCEFEATRQLLADFLTNFSRNKVKIVRLDAVGYVIKKPGTTCFFVEPEIYQFLDWITELANSLGIELLPEVHAHYTTQYKLAERGTGSMISSFLIWFWRR